MEVIFNGKIIPEDKVNLSVFNRGLNYGDGIFETMIGTSDEILFWKDHWERLTEGLNVLGISTKELNASSIEEEIKELIRKNKIKDKARIKFIIWRKEGGLFAPVNNTPEYIITAAHNLPSPAVKEKVIFYNEVKIPYSIVSRFKTLSSLPYILIGIAKNKLNADDLILFDCDDNICETMTCNIFWIKDNVVYTPSLDTGCIEGVMRKNIIGILKKENIKIKEGKFKKEELLKAEFIFTSNVAGIIPIINIEGNIYQKNLPVLNLLDSKLKIQH